MIDLNGVCIAEISGDGCANCEALFPEVSAVAESLGIRAVRIDAAECGRLLEEWQIERIPATVILKDGVAAGRCYGYQPREILALWAESKL